VEKNKKKHEEKLRKLAAGEAVKERKPAEKRV